MPTNILDKILSVLEEYTNYLQAEIDAVKKELTYSELHTKELNIKLEYRLITLNEVLHKFGDIIKKADNF